MKPVCDICGQEAEHHNVWAHFADLENRVEYLEEQLAKEPEEEA